MENSNASLIRKAKTDEEAFNELVSANRNFILGRAGRLTHRYITEQDDEFSIALIAFHEAVQSYAEEKGDFYSFSSVVIDRRLLDYLRTQDHYQAEILVEPGIMDDGNDEEASIVAMQIKEKASEKTKQPGQDNAEAEIEEVQKILHQYGFSFFDLASCSPKSEKTRRECAAAVKTVLEDQAIFKEMKETHTIPAKKILLKEKIKPKILERHRKYIIAACEIMDGDYPILNSYMSTVRKVMNEL